MKKFLLICFVLISATAQSQVFSYLPDVFTQRANSVFFMTSGSGSYGTHGDTVTTTTHDRWADVVSHSGTPPAYQFKSVQDYIKVAINHDTNVHVAAYDYAI